MNLDSPINDVEFEYKIKEISGDQLELSYEIKNNGPVDIYLMTPLYDPVECNYQPDPQQIYSFWHTAYVLHLTKRTWPMSKYVQIPYTLTPYLTSLEVGKSFTEIIKLDTPLKMKRPYKIQEALEMAKWGEDVDRFCMQSRAVTFSVGYIDHPKDESLIEQVYEEDLQFSHPSMREMLTHLNKAKEFVEASANLANTEVSYDIPDHQKTPIEGLFRCDYSWLINNQKYLRDNPIPMEIIAIDDAMDI